MYPLSGAVRAWRTLRRKIRKSLDQRGVAGTIRRCLVLPAQRGLDGLREWTPSRRRKRSAERHFDRQFGIETRQDRDPGWMADIESPNWMHGKGYEPAPTDSLTATLESLQIVYEDFVFVDFGSGKGRSLFVAAQFPFRKIVGVEYSPRLHETAARNIRNFRNPAQKCPDIEAVLEDAARFPIPRGSAVLFFNQPFDEPVFEPVIQRIRESYEQSPRKLFVVYYYPECEHLFEREDIFHVRTVRRPEYVVYETQEAGASAAEPCSPGRAEAG